MIIIEKDINRRDLHNGFNVGIVPYETEDATDLYRSPSYCTIPEDTADFVDSDEIPVKARMIIDDCLADIVPDHNMSPNDVKSIKKVIVADINSAKNRCSYVSIFDGVATGELAKMIYMIAIWRDKFGEDDIAQELYNISERLDNIAGRNIKPKNIIMH